MLKLFLFLDVFEFYMCVSAMCVQGAIGVPSEISFPVLPSWILSCMEAELCLTGSCTLLALPIQAPGSQGIASKGWG